MTRRGSVEQGVRRDLKRLDLLAPSKQSGLAAAVLQAAARLDTDEQLSARDQATLMAELRQTMAELAKRAPTKQQEDSLAQRRARRAAARKAAG